MIPKSVDIKTSFFSSKDKRALLTTLSGLAFLISQVLGGSVAPSSIENSAKNKHVHDPSFTYFQAAPGFFDLCVPKAPKDGKVGIFCHNPNDYGTYVKNSTTP